MVRHAARGWRLIDNREKTGGNNWQELFKKTVGLDDGHMRNYIWDVMNSNRAELLNSRSGLSGMAWKPVWAGLRSYLTVLNKNLGMYVLHGDAIVKPFSVLQETFLQIGLSKNQYLQRVYSKNQQSVFQRSFAMEKEFLRILKRFSRELKPTMLTVVGPTCNFPVAKKWLMLKTKYKKISLIIQMVHGTLSLISVIPVYSKCVKCHLE